MHLKLRYFGRGTFIEIRSKKEDTVVWCDPWINAASYQIAKDKTLEKQQISALLDETPQLHHILVSHTHGDHFADVPEIFYQCISRDVVPSVWGDPNTQALICEYLAHENGTSQTYDFYRGMTRYETAELTLSPNPRDEGQRRDFGLVHNIWNAPDPSPILYLGTVDGSEYYMVAQTVRFIHSKVSPLFVDNAQNLTGDPVKRQALCTKPDETVIPIYSPRNEILGFIFDLYNVPRFSIVPEACTPDRRIAGFGLISGSSFADGVPAPEQQRFGTLDYLFYIPQAEKLLQENGWGDIPSMKVHSGGSLCHGDTE
jgi:hypothetical protein